MALFTRGGVPDRKTVFRATNYIDVTNALYAYENCNDIEKPFYLRRLIAYCIDIRNFVFMKQYIETYVERNYLLKENYQAFLVDFNKLMERIKWCLSKRNHEDIIVNWVDNICAQDFYDTNFAKSLCDKAMFFTKAYTNTPWTHYTYRNIFLGKLPITGKTHGQITYSVNNSPLLAKLHEHNYAFRFIANPGIYQGAFPSGCDILYNDGKADVNLAWGRGLSECSSRLQWLALRERLRSKSALCLWVHDFAETHPPNGAIALGKRTDTPMDRHAIGTKQLDEQLSFYAQFRSPRQHDVYLSDHGFHIGEAQQKFFGDRAAHISLIVRSPKVKPGKCQKLYSHVNFSKLIAKLLDSPGETNVEEICTDYVIGENPDYRNVKDIMKHIDRGVIQLRFYQQIYVRTEEDVYVYYPLLNKELYYRGEDENTNLIDAQEWQERIDYLRTLAPKEYIDIEKEPAFKESKRLYDFIKKFPPEKIPW